MQQLQAKLLAESGIERAEYFLSGGDSHDMTWETDSFVEVIENYGNIDLACEKFGLLRKISSRGKRIKTEHEIRTIVGRNVPDNINAQLTMTSHGGGLVINNKTKIDGMVVLHHGSVKKGKKRKAIPGSHKWTRNEVNDPLPFNKEDVKEVFDGLSVLFRKPPSKNVKDSSVKVIDGDLILENTKIFDNTIFCTGELTLGEGAVCEKSAFFCEQLRIRDGISKHSLFYTNKNASLAGGIHESQFFSEDSTKISKTFKTGSEGSLIIVKRHKITDTTISSGIILEPESEISGHIIVFLDSTSDDFSTKAGPSVVLGKNSYIEGSIITDGDISMRDIVVRGRIWARSIITQDDKVHYRNWLFDVKLEKPVKEYMFPLLGKKPIELVFAQ